MSKLRRTTRSTPNPPTPPKRPKPAAKPRKPEPKPAREWRTIYLLSDSTGNLARHMLTAFLTQFPPAAFEVRERTFLQTPERLRDTFDEIVAEPGIVMHALVSADAKSSVRAICQDIKLPERDLTGDFVEFLANCSGLTAAQDTRRLHHVDAAYERRIDAVEFTMEHDDGLGLETIHEADIVLVGVSRTSKTPTSIYLAQQGFKVGNVSLAMGIDPPRQLLAMNPRKVVGLVIDPTQLAEIRTRRQKDWSMPDTKYNQVDTVIQEVQWSRRLFARQGWPVIDVTNQAIEETAGRIVQRLGLARSS